MSDLTSSNPVALYKSPTISNYRIDHVIDKIAAQSRSPMNSFGTVRRLSISSGDTDDTSEEDTFDDHLMAEAVQRLRIMYVCFPLLNCPAHLPSQCL